MTKQKIFSTTSLNVNILLKRDLGTLFLTLSPKKNLNKCENKYPT